MEDVAREYGHDPEQNIEILDTDGDYVSIGLDMLMSELEPVYFHEDDNGTPYLQVLVQHAGGTNWWCRGGARTGGGTLLRNVPSPGQGGSLFHDVDLCGGGQGAK